MIIWATYCIIVILWFDYFLDSGAEICQIFPWFYGKFKTSKRQSEIIWPLVDFQVIKHFLKLSDK